jgi:hypothetical protein
MTTAATLASVINSVTGKLNTAIVNAGGVLQVVQTTKTNVFSSTSTSFTDITGLSVSITPTSASSKIMVLVSLTAGSTPVNNLFDFILRRNSTNIYVGDTRAGYTAVSIGGGRGIYDTNGANTFAMNFLDSPATTSATTYSVQGRCEGGTFRVNANGSDLSGFVWSFTAASSITVMEIAG